MELIATKRLRASHIPAIDAREIDYGRDAKEQLGPLWEFALTFDGYKYFGGDEDVGPRLGDFAKSIERATASSDTYRRWAKSGCCVPACSMNNATGASGARSCPTFGAKTSST